MLITLLAVFISIDKGHLAPSKLLLTGLGLSSLSVAIISFLIFFSNDESKLKTIIFWSMGSFESARWNYLPLLSITLILVIILFSFLTKNINLLLLGESRSHNLGLNVSKVRWAILIGSAFTTGCAVATSGPIGFVGLMVPHFVRGMFGIAGKTNVLISSLVGGAFLLACDIISREIYPPTGIPIGIITSFMGIPFFVYLLSKNSYRFN
jgi:iron complex transport system permease protein